MNPDQPFNFAPQQGSPASPFGSNALPFAAGAGSPHSPASLAGSNSLAGRPVDNNSNDAQSQQTPASMSMHSGAAAARPYAPAAAVKAPWDDDDDEWNAPSAPAPTQKPAAPPAAAAPAAAAPASAAAAPAPAAAAPASPPTSAAVPPPPPSQPQPPRPSQDNFDAFSGSPAEPHVAPQSPPNGAADDFFTSSPPQGSPNRPPTPPEKPTAVNTAKMDALNKQIANRTATFDAATKEKESKILAAAQEFIKAQKAKREKEVTEAKANHKKEQQADANKIDAYKKSGAVWNAVGMLVDLQKPNQYSKGTEQMRSILSTLNAATPAAPAAAAVKK